MKNFESIALHVPEIFLPKSGVDLTKWAVVACDQFTSEPAYWERVKKLVGDSPSTVHLIFPEVYLEQRGFDRERLITSINAHFQKYLDDCVFESRGKGFVLVDRKTAHQPSRKGLVVALDLEKYDYNKGSQTLIRATEGTVLDRIPPRVKIRENAPIESPHIMVLIDDPEKTVIEPLFKESLKKLYDFDLMMNSGHITGYQVNDERLINQIANALEKLADAKKFSAKYGSEKGVLLYAMGDGNHSLATAKAIWERIKSEAKDFAQVANHPARFALVELVNVHDEGLVFEPIHRVVFGIEQTEFLREAAAFYEAQGSAMDLMDTMDSTDAAGTQKMPFVHAKGQGTMVIKNPKTQLAVGSLQNFIDAFIKRHPKTKVDYIHGEDVVKNLGTQPGNIGFFLPSMPKHDLFKTVILDGALPRKTFSMGEASEKRFYLECRRLNFPKTHIFNLST